MAMENAPFFSMHRSLEISNFMGYFQPAML
jgi:hypothetical protein